MKCMHACMPMHSSVDGIHVFGYLCHALCHSSTGGPIATKEPKKGAKKTHFKYME
jgi:hypothetical protein